MLFNILAMPKIQIMSLLRKIKIMIWQISMTNLLNLFYSTEFDTYRYIFKFDILINLIKI